MNTGISYTLHVVLSKVLVERSVYNFIFLQIVTFYAKDGVEKGSIT